MVTPISKVPMVYRVTPMSRVPTTHSVHSGVLLLLFPHWRELPSLQNLVHFGIILLFWKWPGNSYSFWKHEWLLLYFRKKGHIQSLYYCSLFPGGDGVGELYKGIKVPCPVKWVSFNTHSINYPMYSQTQYNGVSLPIIIVTNFLTHHKQLPANSEK